MENTAQKRRPEDFLELVERAKRGRLKLYVGFAAGVGKLGVPVTAELLPLLKGSVVVIEFSTPAATLEHARLAAKKKIQNDLISKFAGPKFKIQEISMLGSTSTPIEIYVRCNDFEKAKTFSHVVVNELRNIKGTTDIESTIENGDKEMVVKFDREKLAKLGLTIGEIGNQMYMAFEGNRDLKYRDGSNEYDILVSLDEFNRKSKADIENISFTNRSGQLIRLSQVADISEGESPATLIRYNKLPAVRISGNMIGKTIGTLGTELKEKMAKIEKPTGVDIIYAGDIERQGQSFSSMGIALLASIIFMYLIMVALYDSYIYPL